MKDDFEPGTDIGGYRIERRLGSGGMGSVYLAQHPELPRRDALKILKSTHGEDAGFRKRFLREAELAARLDHPNIVTIYNRGSHESLLWIAMQYVSGDDCAVLLKRNRGGLEPAAAVHIVGQVARGLDHAHKAGLLHRDIKPANVLVADDGDDGDDKRVLLTDFGVAKGGDEASQLTAVGTVLATLAYASPEQLCGEELDARSDQYSLAATFFHLITGKVPYSGASTDAVIDAHFNAAPPRISQIRDCVPPAVDAVIARGLAKTPAERYATCKEFATALQTAMRAPIRPPNAHPPGAGAPPPGYVRRPSGPLAQPGPRGVAPGVRGQANRLGSPPPGIAPGPAPAAGYRYPGAPSAPMPRPPATPPRTGGFVGPATGRAAPGPPGQNPPAIGGHHGPSGPMRKTPEPPTPTPIPPAVLVLIGVALLAVVVLVLALAFG